MRWISQGKFYNASDFELKFSQRVRFRIKSFTTRQILTKNILLKSIILSVISFLKRLIFELKFLLCV